MRLFYLLNSCYKIFLELFVWNKKIRRVLKGKFCQRVLKKYINEVETEKVVFSTNKDKTYRIWQYWDSGAENAPDIVKTSLESVNRNRGEIEQVILDDNSIEEYVKLPDYIYELRKLGKLSTAHFSDILRTYLLYEHGGCWIDATVLLTAPLPEYVKQSKLFVFQNNKEDDLDNLNMTNYFMSSNGNSIILSKMKNFLDRYWSKNTKAINYFFYAHAFTLFTSSSAENIEEWNCVFKFPYLVVQQMEKELLDKFSEKRFEQLINMSWAHKLSYKKKVIAKKRKLNFAGTLYEHIVNKYFN